MYPRNYTGLIEGNGEDKTYHVTHNLDDMNPSIEVEDEVQGGSATPVRITNQTRNEFDVIFTAPPGNRRFRVHVRAGLRNRKAAPGAPSQP
jgi:hypothetical protein